MRWRDPLIADPAFLGLPGLRLLNLLQDGCLNGSSCDVLHGYAVKEYVLRNPRGCGKSRSLLLEVAKLGKGKVLVSALGLEPAVKNSDGPRLSCRTLVDAGSNLESRDLLFEAEGAIEYACHLYGHHTTDFADCFHAACYSAEGVSPMLTFDKQAGRLPGAEDIGA